MKIISLSVASFGKLNNVNLNFRDGINVINNINGFGKTTMACFIRSMLYGLNYIKSKGVNDVTRFAPWDSVGKFGGSMTVEHNGEIFRIERFFGSTAKHEECSVINVKTNKQIQLSCEVGEYFLGLTADSYDRSAYFPQEAVVLSSNNNDNLESRLANLVENGAEDYDKVQKNLDDYRKTLKFKKGQGGKIFDLTTQEYKLAAEIQAAVNAERRSEEINRRIEVIAEEKQALLKRQDSLNEKANAVRKKLAQVTLTDAEKANIDKLRELDLKLSRIPKEIEQDKAALDELEKQIASVKDTVKPRVYPHFIMLFIAFVLMVAGAVLCIVLPNPWRWVVLALLIVSGIVLAAVAFTKKGAKTLPAGERDALISDYYRVAGKYLYVNDLDYNQVVKAFWRLYGDYQGDVRERDALANIVKKSDGNSAELENELQALNTAITEVSNRLNGLAGEVGSLTQERKTLNFDKITPQEQMLAVRAEKERLQRRYDVTGTVAELLQTAKDNLSSSYLPRLCARCQELLTFVTNRPYEVVIDRLFNVKIRENGQTKSMNDFSRGIREITLLCFRLALSELLYDKQIPFVIIDDAFVNFDEENFVRATNLLKKVSEQGQVIYFTCHKRTGNLLN